MMMQKVRFQGTDFWLHDGILSPLDHFNGAGDLLADAFVDTAFAVIKGALVFRFGACIGRANEIEFASDSPLPRLFYIQCVQARPVGNCALWWRIDGHGYTCNLDEAWKVTKEKAADICETRRGVDIAIDAAIAEAASQRHVNVEAIRKPAQLTAPQAGQGVI